MAPTDLALALLAMAGAVCIGTVVHEFLHAGILRAAGAPVEITWGSDGRTGDHRPAITGSLAAITGSLAAVRLTRVPDDLAAWQLRVASLSPLVLAAPLLAIGLGAVADPFAGGGLFWQLALVGWLACALPSPQDFSVFWHADRIVAEGGVPSTHDH